MAMKPEDMPAELVTKIETAVSLLPGWVLGEPDTAALHVVAALIPEIQAQALRDAKAWIKASSDLSTLDGEWAKAWNLSTSHALAVLEERAARLTATTEEVPT